MFTGDPCHRTRKPLTCWAHRSDTLRSVAPGSVRRAIRHGAALENDDDTECCRRRPAPPSCFHVARSSAAIGADCCHYDGRAANDARGAAWLRSPGMCPSNHLTGAFVPGPRAPPRSRRRPGIYSGGGYDPWVDVGRPSRCQAVDASLRGAVGATANRRLRLMSPRRSRQRRDRFGLDRQFRNYPGERREFAAPNA